MIRCCVFDADGTLLDSMPMWRDITYEYAEQKGVHAPAGLHNTLNRLSLEQCAQHYQGLGVQGTVEEIVKELGQCALEGYRTRVPEKPHAREFLQLLQENRIPVAVATASNREGVLLALERLGITRVRDLLLHVPHRYLDFSRVSKIAFADVGQDATVVGRVDKVQLKRPRPRMQIVELTVVDETGLLVATFFRQPWIAEQVKVGDAVALSGKVTF